MADLPTGTVTFLFTDLEGSTRLLEAHPAAYRDAVRRHHALLRAAVEGHGGVVFETVGDAVYAAFAAPTAAVAAALAGQRALQAADWGELGAGALTARMGLHTGEVERQGGHYFGAPLYRCARLTGTAHGGQVVLSGPAAALVRDALPEGAALRDLGAHRLKDLQRPEHVYQLTPPGLPHAFPPLRSLDALPNNLPLQLTSFVGREREVAAVRDALEAQRLVTLTGPGGCGKTRLALQVAADALPASPDGVWLAALGALGDAALVPQAVAQAVGVREEPGRPLLATLADALRARRLLLVLDNCEHLLDACARLADALLRAGPQLTILATSREALGLAGETAWPVPPLALPDARRLEPAAALTQVESVALFLDRARAVRPAFRVTEQNAPAVVAICQRLDGIPLALELAAARARVLPPAQLLGRLEDRFRLLTGGSRTALPRHQTLQAAVDWSYALLTEAERRLFARLAVFAGGWTLEAAEAVCADRAGAGVVPHAVLDLLTRLVDQSLVVAEEQPDGTARYRLLETLRQYAAGKLQADGAATAVRDRHREWFAALAHLAAGGQGRADTLTTTPVAPDPPAAAPPARRLEREQDNLRAALAWCRDHGDHAAGAGRDERARLGLRLASDVAPFWQSRQSGEGFDWVETFLGRWRVPDAVRAEGLTTLATWYRSRGDFAKARAARAAVLEICRALGDRAGIAAATQELGLEAATLGDYAAGRAAMEESVALARALGDRRLTASGLRRLGFVHICTREYRAARARLGESLALGRALDDVPLMATVLLRLGLLDRLEGDLGGSRARVGESLALLDAHDLAPFARRTQVRNALGSLALAEGRPDQARAAFADVLRAVDPTTFPLVARDQLSLFGILAVAEGQHLRATRLLAVGAAGVGLPGTIDRPDVRVEGVAAVARARTALGPTAFAVAWAEGQAMPLEQAIADALADAPAPA